MNSVGLAFLIIFLIVITVIISIVVYIIYRRRYVLNKTNNNINYARAMEFDLELDEQEKQFQDNIVKVFTRKSKNNSKTNSNINNNLPNINDDNNNVINSPHTPLNTDSIFSLDISELTDDGIGDIVHSLNESQQINSPLSTINLDNNNNNNNTHLDINNNNNDNTISKDKSANDSNNIDPTSVKSEIASPSNTQINDNHEIPKPNTNNIITAVHNDLSMGI